MTRVPRKRAGVRAARACLLLAPLVLGLACSPPPPRSGPVTIVFKHARILGDTDPLPGLLREFEAAHPRVRVRSEALPWASDDQHQFYVINLEGKSPGLDVMMLDVIWVPEFARAGWLLDLGTRVSRDELAPFFPSAVEAATWNDRVWALPWNMNVGFLFYRADLLAKHGLAPPATWDELIAQVQRIRAAERDPKLDGYVWQGKQYEGLVVNVLEALWARDTRLLGDDGAVFPEPERAAEALAFLRRLIETGVSPAWTTASDEELSRRAFGDGRAIFLRNWPYALPLFEVAASPVRGRVGIAPLPGHAGSRAGAGSTGGSHLGVARATRHPDEALALVRFLTGERAQRIIAWSRALSPSRPALYDDPGLVAANPRLPQIRDLMLAGRPRPITPAYLLLSTTLQPEFSAVLVGLKSPAGAIADGRRRLEYFMAASR
jgi:multiple sugar transport system substrate-binding protein